MVDIKYEIIDDNKVKVSYDLGKNCKFNIEYVGKWELIGENNANR